MKRETLIVLIIVAVVVWFYVSHTRKPAPRAHAGAS